MTPGAWRSMHLATSLLCRSASTAFPKSQDPKIARSRALRRVLRILTTCLNRDARPPGLPPSGARTIAQASSEVRQISAISRGGKACGNRTLEEPATDACIALCFLASGNTHDGL